MKQGYIHRAAATGTRLWINNPTGEEVGLAIAAGAVGCTTNPGYCAVLLDREPDYLHSVMDEVLAATDDDEVAAERVYQRVALRNRDAFFPLYRESGGRSGFAIIQGDPRKDWDVEHLVAEALRHRQLGENIMVKLPANVAGAQALARLMPHDVPTCITEVMGVGQGVYIWETYRRVAEETGHRPPIYVTHITGVLDRYFAQIVQSKGIDIRAEVLAQAGLVVAREQYRLFKERGYDGVMLIGGASAPQYFTELVGGGLHITTDWAIVQQLIEADGPTTSRLSAPTTEAALEELCEKLPDFRRSYYADALPPSDFAGYGPLAFFRDMFLQRYGRLLREIAARRGRLVPGGRARA